MTALQRNMLILSATFAASVLALLFVLPFQAHAALLTQQLDLGDTNSDVTSLQTFLAADTTIYPEGIVSGYFGALTAAAVSRFQSANGLAAVGRVGPQTLGLINSRMGGGTTPVNTSGDISAPTIFPEVVSLTANSANIKWTTSEAANSRVMYGNTWPFLYASAPSVLSNGYNASPNVTITGLQSHSTYYYTLESIDSFGNVMQTIGKPFTTQ
jgi:peptidoglycan hydrolase-like protein with peptidoglycan-binding domain